MINAIKPKLFKFSNKLRRWSSDFSYNFDKNGEKWLLEMVKNQNLTIIFDVGANVGDWTNEAIKIHENALVHCFELSEATFDTLTHNLKGVNAVLNNVGVSNGAGEVQYKDYGKNAGVNTLLSNANFHDNEIQPELKTGTIIKGDDYCQNNQINCIDFLKIDVEGAEFFVLEGFKNMLSSQSINIIQFEYGYTNGDAKCLMKDFYALLESYGYRVGRLRPGRVEFIDWHYALNDFDSGPNYIAIRKQDAALLKRLSAA